MSFKKTVYFALHLVSLKRVKEMEFGDLDVCLVRKIFKAREENPDYRINSEKNIFAANKL